MKANLSRSPGVVLLGVAILLSSPVLAVAQPARARYIDAQGREKIVRQLIETATLDASSATRTELLQQAREVIAAYSALVRRYRSSGYSDNALWNAAAIAEVLHDHFGYPRDRTAALGLYKRLVTEYPTSSLVKRAQPRMAALERAAVDPGLAGRAVESSPARAMLKTIDRTVLPEGVRVTLLLDREVAYREQRLTGPARLYFDLKAVQPAAELRDAVLRYPADAVRQIRVGRHPDNTVRVVLDLEGVEKYSVFTLYNPFRLVIDCEPVRDLARVLPTAPPPLPSPLVVVTPAEVPAAASLPVSAPIPTASLAGIFTVPLSGSPSREPPPVSPASPTASDVSSVPVRPTAPLASAGSNSNRAGGFSLSRQLGLGVSRVVIDPGHGGHDPGAQVQGLTEAELTLDIALRLEELLQKQGLDVVLTRRTNVYVPLEERTAVANREGADLFLSIHANASLNNAAGGVETYFLSFASSAEAEAVAARENSGTAGGMHDLSDIIKAIALNDKLDESRDFAGMVQEALMTRLRRANKGARNLGVKKAPFVVLIGASMPSVLAEVSFLTNKRELQLLKTGSYKQRIAEALYAAILRYRRSLKGPGQVAEQ